MTEFAGVADAIIVAAGASRRMGGIDKLHAPLLGRALLAWTIDAVAAARSVRRVVVVAPPEGVEMLGARAVAPGARGRSSSPGGRAARRRWPRAWPRPTRRSCWSTTAPAPWSAPGSWTGSPPPARSTARPSRCRPLAETVKRVEAGVVAGTVDRADLVTAQTPQGARRELLVAAFAAHAPDGPEEFTDEAALLEASGVRVVTVPGDADNLKVTTPDDLERAGAILAHRLGPPRVGQGRDSHPFGPQDGLALGGIVIPAAPRLHGHSDGDVALHAVADALLGATGQGDLGRIFPAGDPSTRGADSRELLAEIVRRIGALGWRPAGLDLLIVGARPRLGAERLDAMRDVIARLLDLAPEAVSVRASSGNLDGPEGAGRSIAAQALATVMRR